MNTIVYFGMSVALGLIAWFTIFATIIWPKMKSQPRIQQLKSLTAISFFRYLPRRSGGWPYGCTYA